jgi:serine protease
VSPLRRRGVAAAALLCVGVLVGVVAVTRDGAGTRPDGATAQAAPVSPRSSAPATTSAAPSSSTTAPAPSTRPSPAAAPTPSAPKPATPAPWPPAPVGLTGPVSDVLADAPANGPVRIVTVARDAQGSPRITVTTTRNRSSAAALVRQARETPGALVVGVDHKVRVADVGQPTPVTSAGIARATPVRASDVAAPSNDTYRGIQWALDTLQAETAWNLHQAIGQVVAVVDTGVDGSHPDLAAHLLRGFDEMTGSGDGRTDPDGHGTHVAGIISAVGGNCQGVAGLADGASILPVRVLGADGSGDASTVAAGIIWAADHGATVINLSLGGGDDPSMAAAVSYAQSKDVVVVAAAGNEREDGNPVEYPAAYPGVVAVAATDYADASAPFSETGSYVTLAAPGVHIASTYPVALGYGPYVYLDGTSMASPYAAASAALVRAAGPTLTATQVINELTSTAQDLGSAGRDDEFGAGLIDPLAALQDILGTVTPAVPDAPNTPAVSPGDRRVVVKWAPSLANGSPVTRYTVTATPGGAVTTVTCGATAATLTGLTNGNAYTFTVTATNGVGTSSASPASAVVRPNGPIGGRGSWFFLNNQNGGPADIVMSYGRTSDQVLVADTAGTGDRLVIRRGNTYYLRNSLTSGPADSSFAYGRATDSVLVGDWDGDGKDTLAVRRGNTYYIKNSLAGGVADQTVIYGRATDTVLVGDWDGDGKDTLAVRRGNTYYIKNSLAGGVADQTVIYGRATDTVLVGDWDGDGTSTLGVRRVS